MITLLLVCSKCTCIQVALTGDMGGRVDDRVILLLLLLFDQISHQHLVQLYILTAKYTKLYT